MRIRPYPIPMATSIAVALAAVVAASVLADRQPAEPQGATGPDHEMATPAKARRAPEGADDDLKIAALTGFLNADPAESVPLLEKLMASAKSARVREQALFILSQSGSPQARDLVIKTARGHGHPALQAKAIECLGITGASENQQVLSEIYAQSKDPDSRRAVLRAFLIGGDTAHLLQAAKSEQQPELRRDAVHMLGAAGATDELARLYTEESDREVKEAVLHGQMAAGDGARLVQTARNEKDPELRLAAVRMLSVMGSQEGRQLFLEILDK